jgi:hypothetical protein
MPDVTFIIDYGKVLLPSYGCVYQGSGPDIGMHQFSDNSRQRMLVQMAADIPGMQLDRLIRVLFYGIDDGPSGVIEDSTLLALVDMLCAWLRSGNDCIFGCFLGRSRSGYINIAVMMAMTGWPYDVCLNTICEKRPQVCLMQCFVDQLKTLEPILTTWSSRRFAA